MIIATIIMGSHLYGMNTDDSDEDLLTIRIPSILEYLNCNANARKHDGEHITTTMHEFVRFALAGQTQAIDALFSPKWTWVDSSNYWEELVAIRRCFITKNMKAMVGFARAQAIKQSNKKRRLQSAIKVLQAIEKSSPLDTMGEVAKHVQKDENVMQGVGTDGVRFLDVCGKQFLYPSPARLYLPTVVKMVEAYGGRVTGADQLMDFKAMSHAIRVAMVYKELLLHGDFSYPLAGTDILMDVKLGRVKPDMAFYMLNKLLSDIEGLEPKSSLPERPATEHAINWIRKVGLDFLLRELPKMRTT